MEEYTPQPIVHTPQATLITSMDGNVEMQDAQTTIGTNKIKINITKNVHLNKNAINSNENIDNTLAINSQDKETADTESSATDVAADTTDEIEFIVKESMQHAVFARQSTVKSGYETSGLCSIM